MNISRCQKIFTILNKEYPEVKTALSYKNPWQLLVAVILSAQCTDKRVNIVTGELFKKYPKLEDYARAREVVFEKDIYSTGFYKNKAKNIIMSAKKVIKDYNAKVPDTMQELLTLPGVARKTANVLLYEAFEKNEGLAVDTHVKRLSQRLGLSQSHKPDIIEKDLMKALPKDKWGKFSHLLIFHGRNICFARKPKCRQCSLKKVCLYPDKT
ncbi:MAG: endonuclease III [Candidatus Omnitrophica bacterium]|nr:endonuclease III [Candidatus Omnitrophota bacterium]